VTSVAKSAPSAQTEAPQLARVHVERLAIEGAAPGSATALRQGFIEAWREAEALDWVAAHAAGAFRAELQLDLPPHLNGRQLGARIARAIVERARSAAARGRNTARGG
jgi:hypothetical protein